ncbi:hypothetical protein Aph02nite_08220 [Actinoplanes philippinensis]|uniref:Uncharacterized protein n=1 Tax=Actinoplanes philippinensis TaxID=35752 RepID=A0A1I2CJ17_9ACTN|nr:hypothetical protein [Actinoplanes philippinensis]GIE74872.1 hypothetical protein Aph02nite_08220 [Actinoplanes philippinensis]SFE67710.1 hypothetical protein SAMN05421541_1038 [Actinoplanes philippinensis]
MVDTIRRTAKALAVGGLVTAGLVLAAPGSAQAALSGCSTNYSGRTGTAKCTTATNGSSFRVKVVCYKITSGQTRTIYGTWKTTSGATSSASCLTGEEIDDVTIQKVV